MFLTNFTIVSCLLRLLLPPSHFLLSLSKKEVRMEDLEGKSVAKKRPEKKNLAVINYNQANFYTATLPSVPVAQCTQ